MKELHFPHEIFKNPFWTFLGIIAKFFLLFFFLEKDAF